MPRTTTVRVLATGGLIAVAVYFLFDLPAAILGMPDMARTVAGTGLGVLCALLLVRKDLTEKPGSANSQPHPGGIKGLRNFVQVCLVAMGVIFLVGIPLDALDVPARTQVPVGLIPGLLTAMYLVRSRIAAPESQPSEE